MAARVLSLLARGLPLASPAVQIESLRRLPGLPAFEQTLAEHGVAPLHARAPGILQLNVGKMCNQTCRHCHVDAGPDRREVMTRETMEQCLRALASTAIPVVDITGGAPEMNPNFRWLVEQVRALGRHVIDRCNLTILETPTHRDLPDFFAQHQVEVVCSLPHYRQPNTDRQRGDGVFETSVHAMKRLNAVGYGQGGPLRLVLVSNPVGAFLPGGQASLEAEWKREMRRLHDVEFDALYTITNMPISRYLEWLENAQQLAPYMEKLLRAFNPGAAAGVMCRDTISVGWDGVLYDCDFNQQLEMPVSAAAPRHIRDFDAGRLTGREIAVARHCYGCTAGAGSSCGGATA